MCTFHQNKPSSVHFTKITLSKEELRSQIWSSMYSIAAANKDDNNSKIGKIHLY